VGVSLTAPFIAESHALSFRCVQFVESQAPDHGERIRGIEGKCEPRTSRSREILASES